MLTPLSSPTFPALILDSVFDEFFKSVAPVKRHTHSGFPIIDVYSDEKENIILEYALAGYSLKDLNVSVDGPVLTVSSEGTSQVVEGLVALSSPKIVRKPFKSTWTDANNAFDLEKLNANYIDGILKVVIPKKHHNLTKKIQIAAGC